MKRGFLFILFHIFAPLKILLFIIILKPLKSSNMIFSKKNIWIITAAISFVITQACNNSTSSTSNDPYLLEGDTSIAFEGDTSIAFAGDNISTTDIKREYSKWEYSEEEDKMNSSKKYYASVEAKDKLNFDSPYSGGSTATLTVRRINGKNNVFLDVSKGQFVVRSYSRIRLKFDDMKPSSFEISEPADYSNNTIFIMPYDKIVDLLKKHKTLLLEADFYQEGTRQMEFDISNFKWNH